jgi:hypothetical protein
LLDLRNLQGLTGIVAGEPPSFEVVIRFSLSSVVHPDRELGVDCLADFFDVEKNEPPDPAKRDQSIGLELAKPSKAWSTLLVGKQGSQALSRLPVR